MAKSKAKKARMLNSPHPEIQNRAPPGLMSAAPSMPASHLPIPVRPAADPSKRIVDPSPNQASSTAIIASLPSGNLAPELLQAQLPKVSVAFQPISTPPPVPPPMPALVPAPVPAQVQPSGASTSSSSNIPEHLHKNKLQEYAQRSSLPLPIYYVINEGSPHAPKFRATVLIDGGEYTSPNTFSHRKAAEQDVAKLAFESILKKVKEEGCPLIREDTVFCKSILNEFAVKKNMKLPTYTTVQPQRLLPVFVSTLEFNGVNYSGETGRNKKEAEQLAARAVILSLLGDSESATFLSEIIKSKVKLYAALDKVKDPNCVTPQIRVNIGHGSEGTSVDNRAPPAAAINVPISATLQSPSVMNLPHHEFNVPKPEQQSPTVNLPIQFVHPVQEQSLDAGPSSGPSSSKKRRKNKKKPNKRLHVDTQSSITLVPFSQASAYPIAQ